MDRYIKANALTITPTVPATNGGGYPQDGKPESGLDGSIPGAWWFHSITEEIRNAIVTLGGVPDWTKLDQLGKAIAGAISSAAAHSPVFPEDFGALGDGKADDTAALRACIVASTGRGARGRSGSIYRTTQPLIFGPDDVSNAALDFSSSTIVLDGARTVGTEFDFKYGVLSFLGALAGPVVDQMLTEDAGAGASDYLLSSASAFAVGDYWQIQVAPDSTVQGDHIIDLMARVVDVDSAANRVYFDHIRGYPVASGSWPRRRTA